MPAKSNITTSAAALVGTSTLVTRGVLLHADPNNTAIVSYGFTSGVKAPSSDPTSTTNDATIGGTLPAGAARFIPAYKIPDQDLANLYVIAGSNGQRVIYEVDEIGPLAFAPGSITVSVSGETEVKNDSGNPIPVDLAKVAGSTISQGHGTAATAVRVELPTDGTGVVNINSTAYQSTPTVTRPANTTAYTANDVVGGAITFTSAGPSGGHLLITTADLRIDVNAIPSGMTTFRLYLYDVTPPSALTDNDAWDLPSGDRASYLGYIDLGSPADLGSTCVAQATQPGLQVKLASASTTLYGYLVTAGAFTPAANSEVYTPRLKGVAV